MNHPETAAVPLAATVIVLDGEFDVADLERLSGAFEVAARDPIVIVDLSRTDYIDSTVLSELIKLRRSVEAGPGTLLLTQPSGTVLRMFNVAHLASIFEMCPSADEALAELDSRDNAATRITLVGRSRS